MKRQYFLVEDHALMREGVISQLSKISDFECAGSSADSKGFFELMDKADPAQKINTLITDLNISGTIDNGLSFIKECHERYPEVKILVYSMHSDVVIISAALEAGAEGFVSKASTPDELKKALESLTAGRRYIEEQLAPNLFFYERTLSMFSHRESEILRLILQGKPNAVIADELGISKRTVENSISKIYNKTGFDTREELVEHFKEGV